MTSSDIPRAFAEALLERLGLHEQVPEIEDVARQLNLEIEEEDVDGFDGCLVRPVGAPIGMIGIRRTIREASRKRFTIAHEIGHFILPDHDHANGVCTARDLNRWSTSQRDYEQEANHFAAELLIPTSIARRIIAGLNPSLDILKEMASKFGTSLSATAWRYCELTDARCAFVWSTEGRVVWSKASPKLGLSLYSRTEVQDGTSAFDLFQGERISVDDPQRIPAELWFQSKLIIPGATIWEQSMRLRNYDAVISFLWIDEDIERDNTPEPLEELDPDEFTLRRKHWPGRR